jgi:hypothetical protein
MDCGKQRGGKPVEKARFGDFAEIGKSHQTQQRHHPHLHSQRKIAPNESESEKNANRTAEFAAGNSECQKGKEPVGAGDYQAETADGEIK